MPIRAVAGGTKPLHMMEFTCFRCRRFALIIRHFSHGLSLESIQTHNCHDCINFPQYPASSTPVNFFPILPGGPDATLRQERCLSDTTF